MKLSFSLAPLLVLVLCACTEPGGYDETGDGIGQEFMEVHALEMALAEKDEDIRRLRSAIRDVEDQLADVIRDVQMASYEAEARNWEDATYLAQEAADNLKRFAMRCHDASRPLAALVNQSKLARTYQTVTSHCSSCA